MTDIAIIISFCVIYFAAVVIALNRLLGMSPRLAKIRLRRKHEGKRGL